VSTYGRHAIISRDEVKAALDLIEAGWCWTNVARVLKRDEEALGRKAQRPLHDRLAQRKMHEVRA
jgi:hypothetical protein